MRNDKFRHLACDPVRGRMGCDVDLDKVSADQPNDDEGLEQIANGRNNQQVQSGNVRCEVTQEGAPAQGRRSTSLDHVLRDARLSNLEAKLEQLPMDARRIPQTSVKIRLTHVRCSRTSLRGVLRSFLAVRACSWRSRCLTRSFPA